VACGGFSYGDVLGAGEGWAKSILFNPRARDQFQAFFEREDTFSLGVCNGCQMLSNLHELIPGTGHWPHFVRNRSEQFEARFVMVEVQDTPSILLQGMQGSRIPIAVAHGEGRAEFSSKAHLDSASDLVSLRYLENGGEVAERSKNAWNWSLALGLNARFRTPGTRTVGERTPHGCGCSAMPGSGWTRAIWPGSSRMLTDPYR